MTTLGGAVAFCPLPITPAVRLLPAPTVAVLLLPNTNAVLEFTAMGGGNIVMMPVVAVLLVPTAMALLPPATPSDSTLRPLAATLLAQNAEVDDSRISSDRELSWAQRALLTMCHREVFS
jgi:hypothetical protein